MTSGLTTGAEPYASHTFNVHRTFAKPAVNTRDLEPNILHMLNLISTPWL